jgi:hypothetical protein
MDIIDNFISQSVLGSEQEDNWNSLLGISYTCPKQIMYHKLKVPANISTSFYTRYRRSVNKAVIKVVQQTWARQGLLWGDWKCRDLSCGVSFLNCRLEGGVCIRCGSPAYYLEKEISEPETGLYGRCDAIVYSPASDGYLIFKLKSRNTNIILSVDEPYPSDVHQLSAIATLLNRQSQTYIRIVGRVVLWIGTPKPKPYKHWYYHGLGEDLVDAHLKKVKDVHDLISLNRTQEIVGHCKTSHDAPFCPFKSKCFEVI